MKLKENNSSFSYYQKFTKRLLDIIISLCLIIILFIPCVIVAVLVLIDSGWPILFLQKRVGKDGKVFVIYKFRSMKKEAPHELATSEIKSERAYTTSIGKIIRKTSIDELPQLINVLKGDMSLVGPRPLIVSEKRINKKRIELGIYKILPGITGLAQITGRDSIDDRMKLKFDLYYLHHMSFKFDCYIIFRTVRTVLKRENIKN